MLHDEIRDPYLRNLAQGEARWSAIHANVGTDRKILAAVIYVGDQLTRIADALQRIDSPDREG